MKTAQSFGVNFTIKKEKAKDGKTNIYVCVTVNKERALFALKRYVNVEHWDKGKGGLKTKAPDAPETNAYLDQVKFTITTYYQQLQIARKEITPQLLKAQFLGEETDETYSLSRLMDYHNETASAALTWSTMKHCAVTRRYLEKFLLAKLKTTDMRIKDIDYKFIIDFETFLRNYKPADHFQPLNNNGVLKHLIRLRKMTTLAFKLQWISKDPFKSYKFKYKKVETAFLSNAELQAIQNHEFASESLILIRDYFLFACYTGLSYIDMMNLQDRNIVNGEDGGKWLKLFRQKCNEPTNVPSLSPAQLIIDKYKDNPRSVTQGTGQYTVAYSKFNDYVRQNEGKLTESLSDMIADVILQHPEDVELAEEARNIYNLLNSLKQQDLIYTWSTTSFRDMNLGIVAFKSYSNPATQLAVNVRVSTYFTPGKFPPAVSKVETYSENVLSNFGISLFSIFTIVFNEVSFVAGSEQSTHFGVKIREVQFDGALAFVQKFEEFLKTLDAGLILDLESDHVALGYSLPIPSIQTPGFAFFNLTLSFDFRLYFDKRPMSLGFSFATAENKFGIAVYIFAGFGFFSIVAEPKRGIVSIDAALEAGVWAGFSLGPITGEVKLAFGFRYTRGDFGTRLEGYIVAEGRLTIWIIEVSARIYLGIVSENSSAEGSCTVTYSIKLGFFKKSFSGTFYKKISGAETNHQQQAERLHQTNMAMARQLQTHIQQAPAAVQRNLTTLNSHLGQMQTAAFQTTFITRAVTTDSNEYLTETYAVSQQDWDAFFERFN